MNGSEGDSAVAPEVDELAGGPRRHGSFVHSRRCAGAARVPRAKERYTDAELIAAVRGGDLDAYADLYLNHVESAYNLARQLTRSPAEVYDLVAEAFRKVMETLKAGRGPDSAFRAYLLTALRHTAYDKTRRDKRIELSDDVGEVSGLNPEQISQPFTDPAVAGLERSLAAKAFARLPERWQAVLWHTEIEGAPPAAVAPLLGLTPNGVSALAYRAREGLKQAYLQVYLAETTAENCRATTDRLGAWTRDGLSKREKAQVEAHLDGCAKCRTRAAELADEIGKRRSQRNTANGRSPVPTLTRSHAPDVRRNHEGNAMVNSSEMQPAAPRPGALYRGAAVPYITGWSREEDATPRVVQRLLAGIGYLNEQPEDRDERGILWRRAPARPGHGRPMFGDIHTGRQRQAMSDLLCQVTFVDLDAESPREQPPTFISEVN